MPLPMELPNHREVTRSDAVSPTTRIESCPHDPGDIATIEDEGSVGEARAASEQMRQEIGAVA